MFTHNRKVVKLSTGISVEDKDWNEKQDCVKDSHPDSNFINDRIYDFRYEVGVAVRQLQRKNLPLTTNSVREFLSGNHDTNPAEKIALPIHDHWKKFYASKEIESSYNYLRALRTTYAKLCRFEETEKVTLSVNWFTRDNVQRLKLFLKGTGMGANTMHKHLSHVQRLLRFVAPDRNWNYVTTKTKMPSVVHLTFDEIEKLESAVLVGRLDRVRDCFLFMMYTGMRWSDYRIFHKDMIKGDIIEYRQVKTNNFATPFILPKTRKLLEKYDYDLPKYSNQKLNIYLKELFSLLEMNRTVEAEYNVFKKLSECISCHIARKTFITVSLEKGIGVQKVMQMVGKTSYSSMKPYVGRLTKGIVSSIDKW
jgi:integrase